MRLYTFTNLYLSSIQKGIQTSHVVHELFMKYMTRNNKQKKILHEWATDHKTIIVLNGGVTELSSIEERFNTFSEWGMYHPYASFRESFLNNTLTCIGIVLPERVYLGKNLDNIDLELNEMISKRNLAS